MEWYRRDKAAVAAALRRGERPDLATTMASGPLDELVALHEELGIFAIVEQLEVQRKRAGVPDDLLLRTLATLPFVEQASLSGATEVLFREPAVLLQLGWAPVQIRAGSNGWHRHPDGRQEESLPCHPDTLRDALRRIEESAWQKAQEAGVQSLYQQQLVRGKVYAVDGSGLGDELRLVALVCVSATRPIIVAWRVLSGAASEKDKEAEVTHALIEQVLEGAGPHAISLLLADALYADGPRFSWLKYRKGIDALVRLPEDRLLYQDVQGLADAQLIEWTHHRYVRTVQGHKHIREVEVTAADDLSSWEGFTEAAAIGRVTLTCLAFNTAQVYRLQAGQQLAAVAIRRLRRLRHPELGNAPAVIYLAGCYGVFALEELLSLLGSPARESLLPAVKKTSSPDAPT